MEFKLMRARRRASTSLPVAAATCLFLLSAVAIFAIEPIKDEHVPGWGDCVGTVRYKTDARGWMTVVTGMVGDAQQNCGWGERGGRVPPTGLGLLFWPLRPREVKELWESGPRVIKRGDAGFFARALNFSGDVVDELLERCVAVNETSKKPMYNGVGKDGNDFRLVKRVLGTDGEWWSGGAPGATMDGHRIGQWVRRSGFTLVLNHLDMRHAGISRMAQDVESDCGVTVQCNLYLTPPGNQGFEVHWDQMETIVAQVEGRKLWQVYKPLIELPAPEQKRKPLQSELDGSSRREVMLEAGDTLYMPRGWLHEAATNSSGEDSAWPIMPHSMHVTVGVDAQTLTWEDVAHAAAARHKPESARGEDLMHWCIRGEALNHLHMRSNLGVIGNTLEEVEKGCKELRKVLAACDVDASSKVEMNRGKHGRTLGAWKRAANNIPTQKVDVEVWKNVVEGTVAMLDEETQCLMSVQRAKGIAAEATRKRADKRRRVLARHGDGEPYGDKGEL